MLWFETETEPEPLQSLPDSDEILNNPDAELTIYLDKLKLDEFVPLEFTITQGYNENSRSLDARLYYFEHQEVNNNRGRIEYREMVYFTYIGREQRWTSTIMTAVCRIPAGAGRRVYNGEIRGLVIKNNR